MKVLVVTGNYYPRMGGIVTTIRKVAGRLATKGFEFTVLTNNEAQRQPAEETIEGVYVIRLDPRFSRLLYGLSPSLSSFIKKKPAVVKNADIVHVHGYHNLLGLQAAYLLRDKPMVYNPHYHGVASTRVNNLLLKLYKPVGRHVFDYPRKILCVSAGEAELVQRDFGMDAGRISVIGHGVDQKITVPKIRAKTRRDEVQLLYIGQLMKYKGVQYILAAMRSLLDDFGITAHLQVVGRGNYRETLQRLAAGLDIVSQVTWNGSIPDAELEEKFTIADMLLLLSRAEAYGIVVAEALARGIPCIVANTVALNEFAREPGCFGIDYPPSPTKLAALIQRVANNDIKVGLFTSGKIRTWDEVIMEYQKLYQNL